MFEGVWGLIAKVGGLTPKQLPKFLFNLIIFVTIVVIIIFLVLYLAIRLLGLTIQDGKWSIGQKIEKKTPAIVSSTTGWQDSGIAVKKAGAKLSFKARGRICLAVSHLQTLTNIIKPFVGSRLSPDEKKIWTDQKILERYVTAPDFSDDKNVFYRNFIGPEGESHESDLFPYCKLDNRFNAGELLGAIIPNEFSDQDDPLQVLASNPNIEVFRVINYNDGNPYTTKTTGKLAFIVNEVVLSPYSESEISKKSYEVLKQLDSTDGRHKLQTKYIPLVFFSDNIGTFRVIVNEMD